MVISSEKGINRYGRFLCGGWGRGGVLTSPKAGKDDSEGKEDAILHGSML